MTFTPEYQIVAGYSSEDLKDGIDYWREKGYVVEPASFNVSQDKNEILYAIMMVKHAEKMWTGPK